MHTARRKKRSFTGNSARTPAHFSVMFFRKTRLLSRRCICIPQGARNAVLQETQSETSNHFSAMFFRKTRKISDGVLSVLRAKFDAVLQETQPETSNHFSVMFFRKTRKISADVQAYFKRNLTQYSEKPARTSNHFSVMFFRKTRLLSRRCIRIPQGARNAVLQEISARNFSSFFGDVFSQSKENKRWHAVGTPSEI